MGCVGWHLGTSFPDARAAAGCLHAGGSPCLIPKRWPLLRRHRQLPPTRPDCFGRIVYFLTPIDGRYEDLKKGNVAANVLRDFTAGLIVAMVAIPLAMGFAMASGLRPEQGIVERGSRNDRGAVGRVEVSGIRSDGSVHSCHSNT